jgi:hypothetical protein
MVNLYNRIQGRSVERLAALSDGIFAVAMTLLVLDLHIPTAAEVHGERELLLRRGGDEKNRRRYFVQQRLATCLPDAGPYECGGWA